MESLDSIKNSCLETLSSFHTVLKEQFHKEISTTYSFIPHFIKRDRDTEKSSDYPHIRAKYLSQLSSNKKIIDLDRLSRLIYDNQNKISWVDFMLLSSEKENTVYVVELVCLNKKENKLNFHIACSSDFVK